MVRRSEQIPAADRLWLAYADQLETVGPWGSAYALRARPSIAASICGTAGSMSRAEYDFLVQVSGVTPREIASAAGTTREALSNWFTNGRLMSTDRSNKLKRWFLGRLFRAELDGVELPASVVLDDALLLPAILSALLANGSVVPVKRC